MRSYTPYMGAKGKVAEYIAGLMPKEVSQCLIDLFVGGGSVTFAAPKGRVRILNDIDGDIVDMHAAVTGDPEAVMNEMRRLQVSRRLYDRVREMRGTADWFALSESARAARMIFLLRCAFNANLRSPFSASSSVPINFDSEMGLHPFAEYLRGSTFENLHWSVLLDRYVLQQKNLSCVIFADPPYIISSRVAHYGYRFDMVDHLLLARKMTRINERNGGGRNVKVMLTYDDDPRGYIRSLYRKDSGWHITSLDIRYGGGHHGHATAELLITNFEMGEKS